MSTDSRAQSCVRGGEEFNPGNSLSWGCREELPASHARGIMVTHVVLALDCGGLEHVVLNLIGESRRQGQHATVLCLERPGVLADRAKTAGVRVDCIYKLPGIRLGTIGQLRGMLAELRPDIVHTHQIGALFYAGPAARSLGIRAILHTEHGKHFCNWRARWLGRWAALCADRFCCVSQDIATNVVSRLVVAKRKVDVVANGIDCARFQCADAASQVRGNLGIPPEAPVVGTVGRLSEIKGQDVLLRGFARLHARLPNARLLLVGDGPERVRLESMAQVLGLAASVHFAGFQKEPEKFLAAMTVFALTSRSEGMPLAVLEAWAAGRPVVASRVGGIPEIVGHGQTGILFPAGDDVALGDCLLQILADPEQAVRLGDAGRRRVEAEYSLMRMARRYQELYLRLLDRQQSKSRPATS